MSSHRPPAYDVRWYFVELYQRNGTADERMFELFLDLRASDVEWISESTRQYEVGRTWLGLRHLLERSGFESVREIDTAAAASWATHLGLQASRSKSIPSA